MSGSFLEQADSALLQRVGHVVRLRNGEAGEETGDDFVAGDVFGFGFVGEDEAVTEDVGGECFDVGRGDEGAVLQKCLSAGGSGEVDGGAGGGPGADEVFEAAVVFGGLASGVDEIDDVGFDRGIDVDMVNELAGLRNGLGTGDRLRFGRGSVVAHEVENLQFFVAAGVIDHDFEQKAVELSLGKLVGAFLVDGILSGEDEEGFWQRVGGVAEGDLALLHRFEEGGLHFGGGAVDFVGEDQIGKNGTEFWGEVFFVGVVNHGAEEVGGKEIGGELETGKSSLEATCESIDGESFG